MSGTGHCFDNAAVETFFKTIKAELLWRKSWAGRREAEMALFEYINGFDKTSEAGRPHHCVSRSFEFTRHAVFVC